MTYSELTEHIQKEETGIAKGYDINFLLDMCEWEKNGKEIFENLIKRDLELFSQIEKSLLEQNEPKEGDFVEYEEGKFARISSDHQDGTFQLSNTIGVYVSDGCTQASGCTWDPSLDHIQQERLTFDNLEPTSKKMKGSCWMFSEGISGPHRGVNYDINFKVWRLGGKERKRIVMKNKTWQKIGEVLLDYSKILLTIGIITPLVNNINLYMTTISAIIIGTVMISFFGIVIYNKGAKDE